MAEVVITCPETNKTISVGMNVDPESYSSMKFQDNSLECPECGKTHIWSTEDTRLQEVEPD